MVIPVECALATAIIPVHITDLLVSDLNIIPRLEQIGSIDEYVSTVMLHYHRIADKLGTIRVCVSRGEKFSVLRFAEHAINDARKPYFRSKLRRKFEAATGNNCTAFYKNGFFEPLVASAILEEFLQSSQVEKYIEGVRYFFGHRIPEAAP